MASKEETNKLVADDDEDCDVIWEGSPLHEHLRQVGLVDDSLVVSSKACDKSDDIEAFSKLRKKKRDVFKPRHRKDLAHKADTSISTSWSVDADPLLEVEVAQKIIESELLVQEDHDFISNFILTEEAFAEYDKKVAELKNSASKSSSMFADVLLFSGSLAAVAGTILYLSERTRLATTVAAVLPTALAAYSTARTKSSNNVNTAVEVNKEKDQLIKLVELLLTDMQMFKQLVRKSLNLLQGMEFINAGFMVAINKSTGGASKSSATSNETGSTSTSLAAHHRDATTFPALRLATYQCTLQLLQAYREALGQLMDVGPLADYIDLKDHYMAFIDLASFGIDDVSAAGIDPTTAASAMSIKALKDTVQVALVQQSEYLRRFSLVFCERAREDNDLDRSGIIKQINEMTTTIRRINTKLSRVFEYHQAMGLNPDRNALSIKRRQLQFNFVPLRSLYTSLFSSGLHLQNSLLKVRQMETLFDALEKSKLSKTVSPEMTSLLPSGDQLIDWLRGFQDVQAELNACVGCLEEGVAQIGVLKGEEESPKKENENGDTEENEKEIVLVKSETKSTKIIHINEDECDMANFDEVFEAFVAEERFSNVNFDEDEFDCVDTKTFRPSNKFLMAELKQALVGKAEEHRVREERAIERQMKGFVPDQANESPLNTIDNHLNGFGDEPLKSNGLPEKSRNAISGQVNGEGSGGHNRMTRDTNGHCLSLSDHVPIKEYQADPFCPNGSSIVQHPVSVKRGFEDDFATFTLDDNHETSSSDDNDADSSSISSHPSTVRSVGRHREKIGGWSSSESDEEEGSISDGLKNRSLSERDVSLDKVSSLTRTTKTTSSRRRQKSRNFSSGTLSAAAVVAARSKGLMKKSSIDKPPGQVSLSEIRSLSTPDLKQLATMSTPYFSLEDVSPKLNTKNSLITHSRNGSDSSESSDWGSMDELDTCTLKTFRRPLRPAAQPSSNRLPPHRRHDHSVQQVPDEMNPKDETIEDDIIKNKKMSVVNGASTTHSDIYRQKHAAADIREVRQPTGFDASLAAQVVARAQLFGKKFNFLKSKDDEEVFGSD